MSRAFFLLLIALPASAQTLPERAVAILASKCSSCHGETTAMSGLRLTSREHSLKGGVKGPSIVPGKASASRLFQAVTNAIQPAMPPSGKLSEAEIEVLRSWIDGGAAWPEKTQAAAPSKWWAFQSVRRPKPPEAGAWGRTPVDAFVLAKLGEEKLAPAAPADRLTLIRRAYFDLHGLPPPADEVRSFVEDRSPDAWEKLIDKLLASPHYGEKWGRHWLDLVRYGDTAGFEQDPYILEAWRYRDWVIRAFNNDTPYDQFVRQQIAGDEIWPDDAEAKSGTGYFTVGANRDMLFKVEDQNKVETLTDYVDTTSSVFLGLSVACARCHDHKFDPIPQRDYYRMQAIFAPAVKTRIFLDYNPARQYDLAVVTREFKLRQIGSEIDRIQSSYRKRLLDERMKSLPAAVRDAFLTDEEKRTPEQRELIDANRRTVRVNDDEIRAAMSQEDRERLQAIERRLTGMFTGHKPPPMSPGIMDMGREAPRTFLAVRGNPAVRGEQVDPGFLTALGGGEIPPPPEEAETTYRRRALAEWIAGKNNPLTARVMVNRVWHYHFGRGIVATPSDFGTRGEKPSHPELLDWLASEFMENSWSVKKLHKLIMTSAVYMQGSNASREAAERDPQNRLLSHMNRRRLQAEEIRDSVLNAAGTLNEKMGGIPVVPPLEEDELYGIIGRPSDAWSVTPDPSEHTRRSVYLISRRAFRAPMFEVFDSPDGILPCPRRDSSTIAPQSLTLLNGRFTLDQAKAFAERVMKEPGDTRIDKAWLFAFGRAPHTQEKTAAAAFLAKQTKNLSSEAAAYAELGRALFNLNEFLYVD
jgi:hypothetical protein